MTESRGKKDGNAARGQNSSSSGVRTPVGARGLHAHHTPDQIEQASLAATGHAEADGSANTAVGVRQSERASAETIASDSITMPAQSLVGQTLAGRYSIVRKIGQGGMGQVYEAAHTSLGRKFAVKVLLEKYARREAIVARLQQEARLASAIGNEHIIDITDVGTSDDGLTFVVMELLDGESLGECLQRERTLPEQRILQIAYQVSSALAAAHTKGIVHRDVKPENIFLQKRNGKDFVKVVDFGISKSLRSTDPDGEDSPRLTQTGMVLGTPLYMSPEQARGDEEVDDGVDIYALGVIMYEAATGQVPFGGANYLSVISQVLSQEPKLPRELRPDLSEEFEAIVLKAMMKDRSLRYRTAELLRDDIATLLADPSHSGQRAKIVPPSRPKPVTRVSKTKILIWVAAIAALIAAVGVTITVTMGSGGSKNAAAIVDAMPAVADASPPKPPDAAAPVALLEYTIVSEPAGATVYEGNRELGVTPYVYRAKPTDDSDIWLSLELDGYEPANAKIRPTIDKPEKPLPVKLKKLKPGAPKVQRPLVGKGSGAGSAATIPAGSGSQSKKKTGELGGFPDPDPATK